MPFSKLYPLLPSYVVQRSARPQRTNLHVKEVTPEGAVPGKWKCGRGRLRWRNVGVVCGVER